MLHDKGGLFFIFMIIKRKQPGTCFQNGCLAIPIWHQRFMGKVTIWTQKECDELYHAAMQCFSQDLETGCLKLAVVTFLGVQMFKGDHNILTFQP